MQVKVNQRYVCLCIYSSDLLGWSNVCLLMYLFLSPWVIKCMSACVFFYVSENTMPLSFTCDQENRSSLPMEKKHSSTQAFITLILKAIIIIFRDLTAAVSVEKYHIHSFYITGVINLHLTSHNVPSPPIEIIWLKLPITWSKVLTKITQRRYLIKSKTKPVLLRSKAKSPQCPSHQWHAVW